jgi:hypothetical protein
MFIAKHFMGPWDVWREPKDIVEFIEQHGCCNDKFGFGDDDACFNQIELVSEFGEGYPEIIEEKTIEDKFYTKVKRYRNYEDQEAQEAQENQKDQKDP